MERAYDSRLRLASETDTGTVPAAISATGSSGSITILGSEQPITAPATPGTATVTISGTEGSTGCGGGVVVQSAENVTQSSSEAQSQQAECTVTYDTGSVSVTVNGFTAVALYRRYSTSVTVASALASVPASSVDTMQYDAAGNLTGKNGITSSLYDAEGRLCAIANETGGFTQYIYDGNGNRVAKGPISVFSCNVSNNGFSPMVSYVLDTDGKQLTEFNLSSGQWGWAHSNVFASTG
ncbi:MAG: YD repeat-containing protein [Acidobacteriaceae bacterium]|nr:YD repeat-containing protein [Acidobacteriaceae bacterium]